MDTNYHFEADHHRADSHPVRQGDRDLKIVRSPARRPAAPAVEFGSGWYHEEAITHAHDVASHRSM